MNMELRRLLSLMKLEADGGSGGGAGGDSGSGGDDNGGDKGTKTFTQEDLNRIGATEKNAGKLAALKALGFESEADAKAYLEKARKAEEDSMTEAEKIKKEKEDADKLASTEKARAEKLEQELLALKAGANPSTVSDLVLLVRNRMTDAVDFNAALELVKKEASFATLFSTPADNGSGNGTGGAGNPPRKVTTESLNGIGKRLAENKVAGAAKNTGYFSNN